MTTLTREDFTRGFKLLHRILTILTSDGADREGALCEVGTVLASDKRAMASLLLALAYVCTEVCGSEGRARLLIDRVVRGIARALRRTDPGTLVKLVKTYVTPRIEVRKVRDVRGCEFEVGVVPVMDWVTYAPPYPQYSIELQPMVKGGEVGTWLDRFHRWCEEALVTWVRARLGYESEDYVHYVCRGKKVLRDVARELGGELGKCLGDALGMDPLTAREELRRAVEQVLKTPGITADAGTEEGVGVTGPVADVRSLDELRKLTLDELVKLLAPPCIREIYFGIKEGRNTNPSHHERFQLAAFLGHMLREVFGEVRDDFVQMVVSEVFNLCSDFDPRKSEYQIKHIWGMVGGGKFYNPMNCDKARAHGVNCPCPCQPDCPLRGRVKNPLAYMSHQLKRFRKRSQQ